MERKCAVIEITDKFLETVLKGTMGKGGTRYFKVVKNALPFDTSVIRVFLPYHASDVLGVVLASEKFGATKEGAPYPKLELPEVEAAKESGTLATFRMLNDFIERNKIMEKSIFRDKTVTDIILQLAEIGWQVAKSPSYSGLGTKRSKLKGLEE